MSVTKESVIEESKKLGLTLSEDQINAYVLIGRLPEKASDSTPGDTNHNDDEDDLEKDKDLTAGMKERLRKEKEKRNALKFQHDEALKKLKELEDKEALKNAEKDKEKGNWEKLNKEAQDAKTKADEVVLKAKEKFKGNAIQTRLESELLKAGVSAERLSKAVKLFDSSKIEFEWLNEDSLDYSIEDFGSEIENFKKDNDFLFTGDNSSGNHGYQGRNQPGNGGSQTSKEKKREEVRKKYPNLFL